MAERNNYKLNRKDHKGVEIAAIVAKAGTVLTAAAFTVYKNKDKIKDGAKVAINIMKNAL